MRDFLKHYENPNKSMINYDLINRKEADVNLISFIVNACKSLEVCENIKFLGYRVNSDETTIDPESYITRRSTSKKEQEQKYIFINDNRNIELILEFEISAFDKKTNKVKKLIINKKILLPILDKDGYYLLKGKKYYLIYQLLESSTYNTMKGVIVKSFLPISVGREIDTLKEVVTGKTYNVNIYTINMFKKERDILLFYFSEYGFEATLNFFSVEHLIHIKEGEVESDKKVPKNDKLYYFKINNNLYLEVDKEFFENYKYVRSMTKMIMQMYNSKTTYHQVFDKNYYTTIIGLGQSTSKAIDGLDKGKTTMSFFKRMLDINTQLILKLDYENKRDIFALLRCIIMNFDAFRTKDNLDLSTKRLRDVEVIGAQFTTLLSKRFNRIISQKTITLESLMQLFAFPGNNLITVLLKSGLLCYDGKMNDLDVLNKMKYTLKGNNSHGNKNTKSVNDKYRSLDPSKLGRLSILSYSATDPGMAGLTTLMCETNGLNFSSEHEPEDFLPGFQMDVKRYVENNFGDEEIFICDFNDEDDYYKQGEKMRNYIKPESEDGFRIIDREQKEEEIKVKYIK